MSDWTVDTLKEHFMSLLAEKDKALGIALAAAKEAVTVAEANTQAWKASANEWRGAMTDREKNFATKAELAAYKESTEKALNVEKERGDIGQGRGMGVTSAREMVGWIMALIVGLLAVYAALKP